MLRKWQKRAMTEALSRWHWFQLGAIGMSGDRSEKLSKLSVPSLVIHGEVDPLLPLHCGEATAQLYPKLN